MRVDLVGQPVEAVPFLAEIRRLVGRLELLAASPLDVVDDAAAVEAAMQADRDEAGLLRHEAGALAHERERLGLPARLGLDDGDLRHRLVAGLDVRHGDLLQTERDRAGGVASLNQSPLMSLSLMTLNQRSCSLFW